MLYSSGDHFVVCSHCGQAYRIGDCHTCASTYGYCSICEKFHDLSIAKCPANSGILRCRCEEVNIFTEGENECFH